MSEPSHEERLAAAFVDLTGTLVHDFDVIAFLHQLTEHCVDLLDVTAAGVLLAMPQGKVMEVAASDARTRELELAGVEWDEGPCHDCYYSGSPITKADLDTAQARRRWPRFAPRAHELGFTSVAAAPLRQREQVIGALNLFQNGSVPLPPVQLRLGQALADTATIGILQQRMMHDQTTMIAQLSHALTSRVIIEQAKGTLAERRQVSAEKAFDLMRRHARGHRTLLAEIARQVMDGTADRSLLDPPA